jgi:hypothetical protein
MRYLINVIDGTITDIAGCYTVDTEDMSPELFQAFTEWQDSDLIAYARTNGRAI